MLYIQPCANGNLLSLQRKNQYGQEMHNIRYTYPNGNNRLGSISSTGISSSAYKYDALGNLVHDNAEDLTVSWNALGKVDTIRRNGNTLSSFRYSPTGQRQVKTDSSGVTFYIHDATGNVMCIYRQNGDTLRATERYLYGSKRLGVLEQQVWITANSTWLQDSNTIGARVYEFTDPLGNVTYTAQDRKHLVQDSYGQWQFIPFAVTYTDYYPFGFPMPGRSFTMGGYRYFFNGQEADNEVLGEGASLTAEFWQYDTRLGRWWGVDPVFADNSSFSPYIFTNNNPILLIDPDGGNPIDPRTGKPFHIKFTRAAIYTYDDLSSTDSKNPDADLIRRNTGFWRSMYRVRGKPDGLWDGAYSFKHDRSLSYLSNPAISKLKKLFPNKEHITYCSPQESTRPWLCAAQIGTYSFIDDYYCESEVLFIDLHEFNIINVENNYISQITTVAINF